MDINLSSEDLAFRDEVRSFFEENKIKLSENKSLYKKNYSFSIMLTGNKDIKYFNKNNYNIILVYYA